LRNKYLTVEEWFDEIGLECSRLLEIEKEKVVLDVKHLTRTGIFADMDLKIKRILKIQDSFEYAVDNFEILEPYEKTRLESLINTPEGKDIQYAQLLREIFIREKQKRARYN